MRGAPTEAGGRHIAIGDTRLYVAERGRGYPLILLHGGPGLDHHEFGDYLDPLGGEYRLILADLRSQGLSDRALEVTWPLRQMVADVGALARAMGLREYAVLGHSYGAFVALWHAVEFPGEAARTIVSSGVPSTRYLAGVAQNLETFEPEHLRERVRASWEREASVRSSEDVASVMHDQMPFHFADPLDARIADYEERTAAAVYSPDVLRSFAARGYGGIEVEDRLGTVTQPVLALAGRHDRICPVEAAEAIARGVPDGELVVFERSGHMTFVEETEAYIAAVRRFLRDTRRTE